MNAITRELPSQSPYFEATWFAIVATAVVVLFVGAMIVRDTNDQQALQAQVAPATR
jgi:hypothetical protein